MRKEIIIYDEATRIVPKDDKEYKCDLCKDTGIVQSPGNKNSHVCFKCLKEGKLNQ